MKPKFFSDVITLTNAQESKEESKKQTVLAIAEHSTSSEDVSHDHDVSHEEFSIDLRSNEDIDERDQFALWISFAEIYNEQIFDLLEPLNVKEKKRRTVLKLGDDKNGHPYIKGLKHILVCNQEEAYKVLKIGQQNRRNTSTKLNNNSSRSHCIFNLKLARLTVNHQGEVNIIKVSQLSFVDLAGSERCSKTQNTGDGLKEAANTNTSLMVLGKCLEQLKYNQSHRSNPNNVPFRESKLTRLFQVFFCGQGKVSMIVNVSQCASAFDETFHALKFSAIARK
ncbi:kinesin KIF20A, partial [Paramuricea clavata]